MRLSVEKTNDHAIFRIADFDSKYEPVLKMCYYQYDQGTYFKSFSLNLPHLDKIEKRFLNDGQTMFDQLGYFTEVTWEKALQWFCEQMQKTSIHWWLVGSCAACVRGIAMNPHDVDIMIDGDSVEEMIEIFADYWIEPLIDTQGWVTKHFGVIFQHARIDIASDPQPVLDDPEPVDCGPYARQHLEEIVWRGFPIRVPPLSLQRTVNQKRKRWDRVQMIDDFLNIPDN